MYAYSRHQSDEAAQRRGTGTPSAQRGDARAASAKPLAWMDPEIIAVGADRIHAFLDESPDLAGSGIRLQNKLRQAEHTLGDEAERTLSSFRSLSSLRRRFMRATANSDIPFPVLDIGREEARIDSQGYSRWRSSPERDVRKQASTPLEQVEGVPRQLAWGCKATYNPSCAREGAQIRQRAGARAGQRQTCRPQVSHTLSPR